MTKDNITNALRERAKNKNRILNKASLIRNKDKERPILFLEGEDDQRLFSKFIDHDQCYLLETGGKSKLLVLMKELEDKSFVNFLAIIDADFDNILNASYPSPNIIRTETHDLEMLILKLDTIFKNIFSEYIDPEKFNQFLIRSEHHFESRNEAILYLKELILNTIEFIGKFKFWNQSRENNRLKFEKLDFEEFFDSKTFKIDKDDLFKSVNFNSIKKTDISDIKKGIESLKDLQFDIWNICSGHDFIEVFVLGIRNNFGYEKKIPKIDHERIIEFIHGLFNAELFKTTELYKKIKDWEKQKKIFVLERF